MSEWKARARQWLAEDPDPVTRDELRALIDRNDEAALVDRFGAKLQFGTAGLRGVLGAGPNRMNRAVVLRTTAGLCDHLHDTVPDVAHRGVVVGFDGRRMSREFARDAAAVIAGAGIPVFAFDDTVPTPLVAFAVKELNAAAGVMVTASHNPPEYNGYKVYWGNGAQIIPPHDAGISAAIDAVGPLASIAQLPEGVARARRLFRPAPADLATRYVAGVRALGPHPEAPGDLAIVYTAMHGVGNALAMEVLSRFHPVVSVPEQASPDGTFPTVRFPNPEEPGAMDLALALARRVNADVVLANDPDADRLAVAAHRGGAWVQLSGNEVGALLGRYVLEAAGEGALVATTIVSSPLLGRIAAKHGARYAETLTGFKWLANRALEIERESGARCAFAYEEALGYTVGTLVRDKDGIGAAYVMAELASREKAAGRTLLDALEDLYRTYGYFTSTQRTLDAGPEKVASVMAALRGDPPAAIGGSAVVAVKDYARSERTGLPPSDVLAFELASGSRVMARPSGTEPKVKFYFDLCTALDAGESFQAGQGRAKRELDALVADFMERVA